MVNAWSHQCVPLLGLTQSCGGDEMLDRATFGAGITARDILLAAAQMLSSRKAIAGEFSTTRTLRKTTTGDVSGTSCVTLWESDAPRRGYILVLNNDAERSLWLRPRKSGVSSGGSISPSEDYFVVMPGGFKLTANPGNLYIDIQADTQTGDSVSYTAKEYA